MTSGDWINLGTAIVAAVALVVSGFTYRQQRVTQGRTDEQQLNDLIEKIEKGLADLGRPQGTLAFETYTTENAAKLAGLLGQAIEAKKLVDRSGICPDWFQSMVLAYAFTQAWDPADAIEYWERAVDLSEPERREANHKSDYQAHIHSLFARAEFYYGRGLKNGTEDDWRNARVDYGAALTLLLSDPDGQGRDPARQQGAAMLVYQAGLELNMAADDKKAVEFIAEAFAQAASIGVEWRRRNALEYVANFVALLQSKALPAHNVVTPAAEKLRQSGVKFDNFPGSVVALLSLPPDGGLVGAAGQAPSLNVTP